MSGSQADHVCRYAVAQSGGLWRVTREDVERGAFAGAKEATEFACAMARTTAHFGLVSAVVVTADVHELHCFTPDMTAALAGDGKRP